MAAETLSIVFQAVGTGTVIAATQSVIRAFTELPAAIGRSVQQMVEARSATGFLGAALSGLQAAVVPITTAVVGLGGAAAGAAAKIIEMGGAEVQASAAFDQLQAKGVPTVALLNQLRQATLGTVEDTKLQLSAYQALSGQTGITADQFGTLVDAIFRTTRATGGFEASMEMARRALATGRLASLAAIPGFEGLRGSIEAQKSALESQGRALDEVAERQLVLNTVLEMARGRIASLGPVTLTAADSLKSLLTQAKNAVGEFAATVAKSDAVRAAIERLRPVFEAVGRAIIGVAEPVSRLIVGMADAAASFARAATAGGGLKSAFDAVRPTLEAILRAVGDAIPRVGALVAKFVQFIPALVEFVKPSREVVDGLKDFVATAIRLAGPILGALVDIFKKTLPLLDSLRGMVLRVGKVFLESLMPPIKNLIEALKPLLANFLTMARTNLPLVETGLKLVAKIVGDAIERFAHLLRILRPVLIFLQNLAAFLMGTLTVALNAVLFVVEKLQAAASAVSGFLADLFGGGGATIQVEAPTVEVQANIDVTADPEAIADQTRRAVHRPLTDAITGVAERLSVSQAASAAAMEAELAGA